jgi:hypothetical protein
MTLVKTPRPEASALQLLDMDMFGTVVPEVNEGLKQLNARLMDSLGTECRDQ